MEIERKYLVKTLPDHLDQYESKKIAQGYLCTEPVVRILSPKSPTGTCFRKLTGF